jgi:hypothetical protein
MTSVVAVESADMGLLTLFADGGSAAVVAGIAEGELPVRLGAALGLLESVDPHALDDDGRVDLIRAWERCRAMLDGFQQSALAAVADATAGRGLAEEEARHEVGAALRLSPATAGERTWVATSLRRRLPATLAALQAGEISYLQAAHLVTAVHELPDDAATRVQTRVLAQAADQTLAEFKRATRRAVLAADPASAVERHEKAVAARTIERVPLPDAMIGWWLTLPAAVENDAWTALTARAKATQAELRAGAGDDPGLDALRVDALLDALPGTGPTTTAGGPAEASGSKSSRTGRVPRCSCGGAQTAAVVIDLPTLLGMADNPGEIPGYGPIPAPVARAMAADRDWIRWTVDPATGQLLDRSAKSYRPSKKMLAFLAARDRTCGFPGCNRPAAQCDCDHVVTFAHHGQTIRVNLGPLCRQHHNAKTHGLWKLHYDPDTGIKTWTSPLGKTYTKSTDPPLT